MDMHVMLAGVRFVEKLHLGWRGGGTSLHLSIRGVDRRPLPAVGCTYKDACQVGDRPAGARHCQKCKNDEVMTTCPRAGSYLPRQVLPENSGRSSPGKTAVAATIGNLVATNGTSISLALSPRLTSHPLGRATSRGVSPRKGARRPSQSRAGARSNPDLPRKQ